MSTPIDNPSFQNVPASTGATQSVPALLLNPSTNTVSEMRGVPGGPTVQVATPNDLTALTSAVPQVIYHTRGRRQVGDGGSSRYYYNQGSAAVCDGLFVLDGIGGDNTPGDTAATYAGTGAGRFIAVDQSVANAKQAGAVGDGVSDDTFRIQALLNGSPYAIVDNGTYLCAALDTANAGQIIDGRGGGIILASGNDIRALSLSANNIKAVDLVVDGNSQASQGIIINNGTENCVVERCEIRNFTQIAGILIGAGINVHGDGQSHSIIDCYIHDIDAPVTGIARGVHVGLNQLATNCSRYVSIIRGRISNILPSGDGDGIQFQDEGYDAYGTIQGTVLEECANRGIKIQAASVMIEGVSIINETVEPDEPISIYDNDVTLRDFFIYGKRLNEGVEIGSAASTVENCHIEGGMIELASGETVGTKAGIRFAGVTNRVSISGTRVKNASRVVRGNDFASTDLSIRGVSGEDIANIGFEFDAEAHNGLQIINCHAETPTYVVWVNLGARQFLMGVTGSAGSGLIRQDARTDRVVIRSRLFGKATYDPPSLADGARATTTVTVTGAALGDFVKVSFSRDLQGVEIDGYVSVADTITVVFENRTGGPIDLAEGTLRAESEASEDRNF